MQFIRRLRLLRRLLISRCPYACAQEPSAPFEGWRLTRTKAVCCVASLLRSGTNLSLLCRISPPLFHRVTAGGEAWGLHSRVTRLPERAFSTAFSGLLAKVGGAALGWTRQRKKKMHDVKSWFFSPSGCVTSEKRRLRGLPAECEQARQEAAATAAHC